MAGDRNPGAPRAARREVDRVAEARVRGIRRLARRSHDSSARRRNARDNRVMTAITPELIASHGLTSEEFQRIEQILGRAPNYVELGIFSVMWSEHCSYKSSRVHLKKFPTTGPRVIQGPGENAGVSAIANGWLVG